MTDESDARRLDEETRNSIIRQLVKNKDGWIETVQGFLAVIFMIVVVALGAPARWWLILWYFLGFIVSAPVAIFLKKKWGSILKFQVHSDETLEVLYDEMERKKRFSFVKTTFKWILIVIFIVAILASQSEYFRNMLKVAPSDASCEVLSQEGYEDMFITSDGPDYAVTVASKVRNKGPSGDVLVRARIHNAELDLERMKIISLDKGVTQDVKFSFQEVTVEQSKDIKYSVECYP